MEGFISDLEKQYPQFSKDTIDYTGRNYGEKCHEIFNLAIADKSLTQTVSPDGEILAEVVYVIKNEMVFSLSDIFFRRTGIGTLGYPGDQVFNLVKEKSSELLNWSKEKTKQETMAVMEIFKRPS
jgi:glycerol-3-phosphate dehydrogenase